MNERPNFEINRRAFLGFTAGGLGYLALSHLHALEGLGAESERGSPDPQRVRLFGAAAGRKTRAPLAPKPPHHTPKAKAVICLFQHGGPSQMDLFDPKPELNKWDGKDYPGKDLEMHFDKQAGKLL